MKAYIGAGMVCQPRAVPLKSRKRGDVPDGKTAKLVSLPFGKRKVKVDYVYVRCKSSPRSQYNLFFRWTKHGISVSDKDSFYTVKVMSKNII